MSDASRRHPREETDSERFDDLVLSIREFAEFHGINRAEQVIFFGDEQSSAADEKKRLARGGR